MTPLTFRERVSLPTQHSTNALDAIMAHVCKGLLACRAQVPLFEMKPAYSEVPDCSKTKIL